MKKIPDFQQFLNEGVGPRITVYTKFRDHLAKFITEKIDSAYYNEDKIGKNFIKKHLGVMGTTDHTLIVQSGEIFEFACRDYAPKYTEELIEKDAVEEAEKYAKKNSLLVSFYFSNDDSQKYVDTFRFMRVKFFTQEQRGSKLGSELGITN